MMMQNAFAKKRIVILIGSMMTIFILVSLACNLPGIRSSQDEYREIISESEDIDVSTGEEITESIDIDTG